MNTFHRIKILLLSILTAILVSFPLLSIAASWSEQDAFCQDRLMFSGSNSLYTNQKIYNECMDNADERIEQYEKTRLEVIRKWEEGKIAQQKKYREEQLKDYKIREVEKKREKRKNEQEIKKYDDLFSEFDN